MQALYPPRDMLDALQFYRSVVQLPLQPPPGNNGVLGHQHGLRQQQQQQQHQRASSRGFGGQPPQWTQRQPQQQQQYQQDQQQHLSASIPSQQQQYQQTHQQQHQQDSQLPSFDQLNSFGQAPQQQPYWPPTTAQHAPMYNPPAAGQSTSSTFPSSNAEYTQHQGPAQQDFVHQQQHELQQQSAQQSTVFRSGQHQAFSPAGRTVAGGTPVHVDAQVQPTPSSQRATLHHQREQQSGQHQHIHQQHQQQQHQQLGQKHWGLHHHQQHQQQQVPLQDVSNLQHSEQDCDIPHEERASSRYHQHQQQSGQSGPAPMQSGRQGWQQQQQRQQHQQQYQQEHGISSVTPQSLGRQQQQHNMLEPTWPPHPGRHAHRQQQQQQSSPWPQHQHQQQQQRTPKAPRQHRARASLLLQQLASFGEAAEEDGQQTGPAAAGAVAGQGSAWQRNNMAAAAAGGSSKSTTRWPWLGRDRKDAQGRQPGTPGYDPSTLYIPPAALAAMSDFGRQFWGIKRQAMDLVLFVRHGSFYNLFDVDADVGLRVGLNLSGAPAANMWKVGCHINQFAVWAAKVLAQGYSVGRVEEMPAATHRARTSSSNKLLERRLVRIYTPGTAVEGLLLDDQDDMPHPLMCIVEIPYSTAPQHTYPQHPFYSTTPTAPTATAHAVGICILDISSGVCRVGTFSTADDPARSALAVALLMADPSEAVAVRNSLAGATVTLLKRHFEIKTAAGPGFSSSGGSSGSSGGSDGGCGDRARGQVPGVSWLPTSVAGNVIGDPTGAVLEGCLSEEQLQQLRQIAAQAAVAVNTSSSSSSRQAAESAAAAVLAAVGVGVKQLERCSLLSDVLPTLEVQPLEALTAHEGVQPGRPLLLDNNAIITLDLLPLSHINSSSSGMGATAAAASASKGAAAVSSLFGLLDRTVSAAGKRKLRQWICRPLTVASAIKERLDVLDLFLQLPTAASGLQQRLADLPDTDRLLPKAAVAVRALLQHEEHVLEAHQQMEGVGGGAVVDPMLEGSSAERERAWKSLAALPTCLLGLIKAVATLRSEVSTHIKTDKLPLLRRAELAAAKALAPANAVNRVLFNATWADAAQAGDADAAAGAGRGKAKKRTATATAAAAAAAAAAVGNAGSSSSSSSGIRLAAGADEAYDAAVAEQQHLRDSYEAELQAQLQWYSSRSSSGSSGGGWGRQQWHQPQQQQQQGTDGEIVQEVFVVEEAEGVLGMVLKLSPAEAAHPTAASWSQTGQAQATDCSAAISDLLAPGHTVIKQELLQDALDSLTDGTLFGQQQQQQYGSVKPPTGRGAKAAGGGRGRGRKGGAAGRGQTGHPSAAAAAGDGGQLLLLHIHVPELQQMWLEVQAAEHQVTAAAAAALDAVAQTFLGSYSVFRSLVAAVADLDVLAGFAQVVCPGNAPPGCSFCRPQFAAAAADPSLQHPGSTTAPLLQLDGLWHPLLGMQSSGAVVPNDVVLGGDRPGAMLLTGANMGGKSTLLRSTCVAVIMAQLGCYVAAKRAVVEPVDAIFTRIGAADAIMCGKSTFMVEMSETAACLAAATPASLIVLDELGRGTSTHDGYALAYAVLRHLACPDSSSSPHFVDESSQQQQQQQQQANGSSGSQQLPRVLFATHYHMLTQEADLRDSTQSCHMSTRWDEVSRQLVHCYKLQPGPAAPTGSCGVEVAALAGLPGAVVQRAAVVAAAMQEHCEGGSGGLEQTGLLQKIQQM